MFYTEVQKINKNEEYYLLQIQNIRKDDKMQENKAVRSSAEIVTPIEVNVDTVYVRYNIEEIDEDEFKSWQYDEVQYDLKEYIASLTNTEDSQIIALLISSLMSEIDTLTQRLNNLEG
jgi:anaerobic ribonucleoside-triphosphate reductase